MYLLLSFIILRAAYYSSYYLCHNSIVNYTKIYLAEYRNSFSAKDIKSKVTVIAEASIIFNVQKKTKLKGLSQSWEFTIAHMPSIMYL